MISNKELNNDRILRQWKNESSAPIWALVCGFPPGIRENRLMLIMQAYVDDSGKGQGQPPVFVLAGYVARAEQWALFSERWKEILDIPPKLEYFKMEEAAHLRDQFRNWTESERNKRLLKFIKVIQDYVSLGIKCVIYSAEYDSVIKRKIARKMDNPYFLSFYSIMAYLYKYHENNPSHLENLLKGKIDFIFDEQFKQFDQTVLIGYKAYVELAPNHIKPILGSKPIQRDDKEVLPLQAADMIAWNTRRYYYEQIGNKNTFSYTWQSLSEIWESLCQIKYAEDIWGRHRLISFIERTKEINLRQGRIFPYDQ